MRILAWIGFATVLAACATAPRQELEPEVIQEVRDEAQAEDSVVEVSPLVDPQVQELQIRAQAAEQSGELERSRTLLTEALELAPRDPQLWQQLAELDFQLGEFQSAIDRARHSFEIGPRVGSLCSRNWLTIARAHRELENAALETEAREAAESCPVRARERL